MKNLVTSVLSIAAFAGCTVPSDSTESPVAILAASAGTTADLGVTTWEVRPEAPGTDRLIGLDASNERVLELTLHPDSAANAMDVETDEGMMRLTPAGVQNAPSTAARMLGVHLGQDLGTSAVYLGDTVRTVSSEVSISDPRIQAAGTEAFGYNFFNQYRKIFVGGACRANTTRHHGDIVSDFGALGVFSGFQFPNATTDCNAIFEMFVNNGHWDNFHWRVFNQPDNIAAFHTAWSSSTDFGGAASRAVDNNTDGNFFHNSVTHTALQYQPWWQVDLGSDRAIGGVKLFNRTDSNPERLSNFDLLVSNDGVSWNVAAGNPGPANLEFPLPPGTHGRYVRVQLRNWDYLSLAEVQVFAP